MSNGRKDPIVSIIFPVKNEGEHIKNTLHSLMNTKTNFPFEAIVVDDGCVDGCCNFLNPSPYENVKLVHADSVGLAMARNTGADHAKGEYLIFCDAHLFFEDYWIDRLIEPIGAGIADAVNPGIADAANPSNVGYGYFWNHLLEPKWNLGRDEIFASPLLAGGCFAISKAVFEDVGGFERGFRIWGKDDEEISLKLWLFGYKCYAVPDVKIKHIFRTPGTVPFTFTWDDLNYNIMRMVYSHLNEERIEKAKGLLKHSDPDKIVEELLKSDILEQRERYFKKRKYDDDWFMQKFNINF